jgi:integrase
VEFLLMGQMRISNLSTLDLERNIVRTRASGRGAVHLVVRAENVKNEVAIEAELPSDTVKLLDLYLNRYRPLLLTCPSPWLFPGSRDGAKSRLTLGIQISKFLLRESGLRINPHLFRHIGAKLYLDAHLGAYGVMRLMLGHRSVDTTTRSYCGAETAAAMRHFDAHVLRLRGQALPLPQRRTSPNQ